VRMRSKFLALTGSLAVVSAFAFTPVASATAPVVVDVSNHSVTCNDIIGSIGFSTPLTLTGPTTGSNTITIKIKSDDCTDTTSTATCPSDCAHTISLKGSSAAGTLTSTNGSNCVGLSGLGTSSGDVAMKWTTNAKSADGLNTLAKITPTASTFHITQSWGGEYNDGGSTSPSSASDSWGGIYGFFAVGAAGSGMPKGSSQSYTTAPTVTGAFTGGDSGHKSTFQGALNQSIGGFITACGKGLKKATFAIGGTTLG
jgi:hypothetical protein